MRYGRKIIVAYGSANFKATRNGVKSTPTT